MLFLAFKPCVDECSVNYCQTEGIEHIEEKHTEDHYDSCSPLCNCLCCNTLVSISKKLILIDNNTSFNIASLNYSDILQVTLKPNSPPPKA